MTHRGLRGLIYASLPKPHVARRAHYRVHLGLPSDERGKKPPRRFEFSAEEVPDDFRAVRLVEHGRFGWLDDEDEIVARNDAVFAIARDLRITHELPCVVAFDGIPSPETPYAVFPLGEARLSGLYQRIRTAIGELQAHPGFDEYTSGLRTVHTIARQITALEQGQVSEQQRSVVVHDALTVLAAALREGARRRFAAALSTLKENGIDRRAECGFIDWQRLRSLRVTSDSLRQYAASAWPLADEASERLSRIFERYARPLLGDKLTISSASDSAAAVARTVAELDSQKAEIESTVLACFPSSEDLRKQLTALDDQRLALEYRLLTETRAVLGLPDRPSFCKFLRGDYGFGGELRAHQHDPATPTATADNVRASWLDWLPIGQLISWLRTHNTFGFLQFMLKSLQRSGTFGLQPRAFASYASVDRPEVIRRVQGIRAWQPGLDIFVDFHSLYTGEFWRARILEEIRKRDRFLLFWSRAARESKEVEYEWRASARRLALHDRCHRLTRDSPQVRSNLDPLTFLNLNFPRGTRQRSRGLDELALQAAVCHLSITFIRPPHWGQR